MSNRSLLFKAISKTILIVFIVDLLLFTLFFGLIKPTGFYLDMEWLLLIAIFITNICLAVATKYTLKRLYIPLLVNSILAAFAFHALLKCWFLLMG
jgi:hypothetical protein